MITERSLLYAWETRHIQIQVEGMYLDEETVQYTLKVLSLLEIPPGDCYLSDRWIVHDCIKGYQRGIRPSILAHDIREENKSIGEYA